MATSIVKNVKSIFPNLTVKSNEILEVVLRCLNENGMQIVFVEDEGGKLVGVCSDGDVRRSLLSGINIDAPVSKIMNKEFIFLYENFNRDQLERYINKDPQLKLPIVDSQRKLKDLAINSEFVANRNVARVAMVIMAGGKGTRLYPYTLELPKPLVKVDGIPIIQRIVDKANLVGVENFYVSINHFGDQIKAHFSDSDLNSYKIDFLEETFPMGTGGSLSLIPDVKSFANYIVTNGDVLLEDGYNDILTHHIFSENVITMVVKNYVIQNPYGVVITDGNAVTSLIEKPKYKSLINAGVYVLRSEILDELPNAEFSLPDLIEVALAKNHRVGYYVCNGSWFDVGTPVDLSRANEFFANQEQE